MEVFNLCGIAGFIGKSKNPELSYALITQLFSETESRGKDASGYWGIDSHNNILYQKDGVRASEFVKNQFWKKLKEQNPILLLTHCRSTSPGTGDAKVNDNNHPFVSNCRSVGLIHNGNIVREFRELRKTYEVSSECDSEVLLRIFESKEDQLEGIGDIWSFIHEGSMAVVIGEKEENSCRLWMFRNELRELWLVDLRDSLGQLFFCSDPDIWIKATQKSLKQFTFYDFIELPTEEIWSMEITEGEPVVTDDNWCTYEVKMENKQTWKSNGRKIPIKKMNYRDLFDEDLSKTQIEEYCQAISDLASDIEIEVQNQFIGGMSLPQLDDLEYQLNRIKGDLQDVLKMFHAV